MKIVLLQPPIQDFYQTKIRLQPIGLACLKAVINKFLPTVAVKIRDYHQGWGRKTIALPGELTYLQDYYPWADKSPFALFHHFYHFGADFRRISEEIASEQPDLVGISSLFSPYYREVLKTAHAIKDRLNIPIVIGGAHVSADPESMLKDPAVDFVIRGEGERPIVQLIKAMQAGTGFADVPNLGFKQDDRMVWNPVGKNYDLEELPWPDLSDLPRHTYLYHKKPLCFVMTSRGCPYDCTFCSIHQVFDKKYRRRSLNDVVQEIKYRYDHGYRVFDFEDDNLSFDLDGFKNICRRLIDLFPRKDVTFHAMNGICYYNLDDECLGLMRQAGFTDLNLSLVSADGKVNRENKRPHSLARYRSVVETGFRKGFKIVSYQILGLPNESVASMVRAMCLNAQLPVLIGASPFYLTPGVALTKNYADYQDKDLINARLTALGKPVAAIEREDIYTLFIAARIINFLKSFAIGTDRISLKVLIGQVEKFTDRQNIGIDLLKVLLMQKLLYARTSSGLKPLNKFRSDLFFDLWNRLKFIRTQQGKIIRIP